MTLKPWCWLLLFNLIPVRLEADSTAESPATDPVSQLNELASLAQSSPTAEALEEICRKLIALGPDAGPVLHELARSLPPPQAEIVRTWEKRVSQGEFPGRTEEMNRLAAAMCLDQPVGPNSNAATAFASLLSDHGPVGRWVALTELARQPLLDWRERLAGAVSIIQQRLLFAIQRDSMTEARELARALRNIDPLGQPLWLMIARETHTTSLEKALIRWWAHQQTLLSPDPAHWMLPRAGNQLEQALAAAERFEGTPPTVLLLMEMGRWSQLARHMESAQIPGNQDRARARKAMSHMLDGHPELAARWIEELTLAYQQTGDAELEALLLLLGRTSPVFERQMDRADDLDWVNLHVFADRWTEVFDFLDRRFLWEPQAGHAALHLYQVLSTLAAPSLQPRLEALRVHLMAESNPDLLRQLVVTSAQRRDASTAWNITRQLPPPRSSSPGMSDEPLSGHQFLLNSWFTQRSGAALAWWQVLEFTRSSEEPVQRLQRIDAIFLGRLPWNEVEADLKVLRALRPQQPAHQQNHWFHAEIEAALGANRLTLAQGAAEALAAISPAEASALQGSLRAEQSDWEGAAAFYGRAAATQGYNPLHLHQCAAMLRRAGQIQEANRLDHQARMLPLGHVLQRLELVSQLEQEGLHEQASDHLQILSIGVSPAHELNLAAMDGLGRLWFEHERVAQASIPLAITSFLLLAEDRDLSSIDRRVLLRLGQRLWASRAAALAAEKRTTEAVQLGRWAIEMAPTQVDVPIAVIRALDQADARAAGDELFRLAWDFFEHQLVRVPDSANLLNNQAWMAARCQRRLPEALNKARRAVKLAPDNAAYLDTLAEILFIQGDRDQAMQLMRLCRRLDPHEPYFRSQIRRFAEAATPLP